MNMKAPQGKENLPETARETAQKSNVVLQPAKLERMEDFMEVITLMGNIAEKAQEQRAQFIGDAATKKGDQKAQKSSSARDKAIASLPATGLMQRKLVVYIEKEIKSLERQAKVVMKEKQLGWAFEITRIFARIRRLSALAQQILRASIETVKRFYIHVFIDNQPLLQGSWSLQLG